MINVGIIGIGFMGVTHYKALKNVKGARVAAICTRDPKKLAGDWRSIKGNFGDSGGMQDLGKVARYPEIEQLLGDPKIDLVDICLPTHLHREVTIAALRAGKHVLVEKPIAVSLKDADAMIAAAAKAGKLLMVGQVLRFFPPFAEALAMAHSGKYGSLQGVHLKRIISTPKWAKDDHFEDAAKSGGPAIDLHIHDTDFIHYLAGPPAQVHASGLVTPSGAITYINTQYFYPAGLPVATCQSGAIATSGLSFEHGYDVYLEGATLHYNNLETGDEIRVYTADGKHKSIRSKRREAFAAQLAHAVECVVSGKQSNLISAESARLALHVCLQELKSVHSGKMVRV